MINRRLLLLSTTALFTVGGATAKAAITDSYGNAVNAIGPHTVFTGLNVSGGGGGNTLTITSIGTTGTTSSTITFNFSYTGSAPTGLTAVWQSGSITGTISGFSTSSGTGSATVTTPSSAATYTLHITGTGPNTATATAPNTTVISTSPTITLSSVPTVGLTSNTVPITFTYTGAAPSGLTALWQSGSVSGTVSGFTATGGSGSATISTPASTASYTLHITGTGSNTGTATASNTTVVSTSSTITITSMPSTGSTSSTLAFNFTYTGTRPTGMSALWQSGSVSATISGFSTAGTTGSATVTTPASAATYTLNVTGTGPNTTSATAPNTTVVSSGGVTAFPGQPGNPVGYAAAPGFTSLTSASATISAGASFKLFDGAHNPVTISGTNLTFTGCYFGVSTNANTGSQGWITYASGGGHTFNYCTFGPSPSVVGGSFPPLPPSGGGYSNWPSLRGTVDSVGLPYAQGNQYGVTGNGSVVPPGGVNLQNCDIWGFSNGAVLFSNTNASNPITVNNTWMHDPCLAPPGAHTDVIGDVQSQNGDTVTHFTMTNCTCAGVSSEGLAFQFNNDIICNNITITGNYFSNAASFILYIGIVGINTPATNYVFSNNTLSAIFTPEFGVLADGSFPNYATPAFSVSGSGNKWRNNQVQPGNYIQFTATSGTPYLWPNATANASDFTGAF